MRWQKHCRPQWTSLSVMTSAREHLHVQTQYPLGPDHTRICPSAQDLVQFRRVISNSFLLSVHCETHERLHWFSRLKRLFGSNYVRICKTTHPNSICLIYHFFMPSQCRWALRIFRLVNGSFYFELNFFCDPDCFRWDHSQTSQLTLVSILPRNLQRSISWHYNLDSLGWRPLMPGHIPGLTAVCWPQLNSCNWNGPFY